MAAAVPLRCDYNATELRELAKQSADADQTRRLLALALVYDGASRSEGADERARSGCRHSAIGCCGSTRRGPAGLVNGKAPGQPPRLDAKQRA